MYIIDRLIDCVHGTEADASTHILAENLLMNALKTEDLTVNDIAAQTALSASTISRFARQLGFSSVSSLLNEIGEDARKVQAHFHDLLQAEIVPDAQSRKALKQCAALYARAGQVMVTGHPMYTCAFRDLEQLAYLQGRHWIDIHNGSFADMEKALKGLQKEDLLFIIDPHLNRKSFFEECIVAREMPSLIRDVRCRTVFFGGQEYHSDETGLSIPVIRFSDRSYLGALHTCATFILQEVMRK